MSARDNNKCSNESELNKVEVINVLEVDSPDLWWHLK